MVRRALVRAVLAPQVVEQRQAGSLAAGLGVGAWQKKRPYGEESSSERHWLPYARFSAAAGDQVLLNDQGGTSSGPERGLDTRVARRACEFSFA